jgi:Family of unknown function (DUF6035)
VRQASITVAPLEQARAVANPAIVEVLDLDTGEFIDAAHFITGHLYQSLIYERVRIVERMNAGHARFVCADCQVPVYLVSRAEAHIFFFRHRSEDGSCPAQTRSPLTADEICARKYHGLRESEPHRKIKALIERGLNADPKFSGVVAEKTWRGTKNPKNFRRPDVQAESVRGKLAFEVQLSTTFLSVVVGRRSFYRNEGALLVWVFGGFDPDYRLLTTDDLLFSNNSNVFVVDEETTALSEMTRVFHLRCHHRCPVREGDKIADGWQSHVVPFHELVQDRDNQQIFLFDYARAEASLLAEIEREVEQRKAVARHADRQDLFEFWLVHGRHFSNAPNDLAIWAQLRERYAARGLSLPAYPDGDAEFRAFLNSQYSAEAGSPIGWNFKKLIEVGHCLAESHPRQLLAFGHALNVHNRKALIESQDVKGKWRTRIAPLSVRMKQRDATMMPDKEWLPLMSFLFPDVAKKVTAFLDKSGN